MNDKQRRRYERGQRVDVYMGAAAPDFPGGSKGGALIDRLKELLAQVAALDVESIDHKNTRRHGTEGREVARTALRQMLKSAWDTYKAITLDRPDLKGLLDSPAKSKTDQALVSTARSYANAPLAPLFAEYGLTEAFFNDLRAQAERLETNIARQNAGVNEGVDTTAAVEETLGQMDDVVERLEAVVRNRYAGDSSKLAAWETASRVERAPRRRPEDDAPAPPPPPPADG